MLYKKITKSGSNLVNHTAEISNETPSSSENESSSEESDECSSEESDVSIRLDQKVPQIIDLLKQIDNLKNKIKNKEFFYLEEKKNLVRFFF